MAEALKSLEAFSGWLAGQVWGLPMVFLLFGAGAAFTILNRGVQFTMFRHALDIVRGRYSSPEDEGEISHFQALCAALSATVGLGNIAGVTIAISLGGPGAVFWLWVAGCFGMASKFTEVSLALMHREKDASGQVHGGPMFTIKNGLGGPFLPLAGVYALFTVLSSFGAGNMFQANNVAGALKAAYGVPTWASGALMCVFAGLVLIGGIKRIGSVAGRLVPIMCGLYLLGALGIILARAAEVPDLLARIVTDAFAGTAAVGGFAGASAKEVLIQGVRRAVFSNEAGMGSAAIAHSAVKEKIPVREGFVALLEPFIDTIVVCTMTALVVLLTGAWSDPQGLSGAALTAHAFSSVYGGFGTAIVNAAVVLFAFSTIISWAYYGERGVVFLFGARWTAHYRYAALAFVMIGSLWKLGPVLDLSDAVFGLMALPNLLASFLLIGKLSKATRAYVQDYRDGKFQPAR